MIKGLFFETSVCSHDSAKFTGHKSCESGGIFFSVCHMASRLSRNHRVSKEAFPDKLTLSMFGGHLHCGSRDIMFLLAKEHDSICLLKSVVISCTAYGMKAHGKSC